MLCSSLRIVAPDRWRSITDSLFLKFHQHRSSRKQCIFNAPQLLLDLPCCRLVRGGFWHLPLAVDYSLEILKGAVDFLVDLLAHYLKDLIQRMDEGSIGEKTVASDKSFAL